MIDRALVWRLLGLALGISLAGAAACLLHSPALAGGLLLGSILGAAPFASWVWISGRLATGRGRVLAVLLVLAKLGLYSGALYLFVTRSLVNPVGVLIGIPLVVGTLLVGALAAGAPHPKGAA